MNRAYIITAFILGLFVFGAKNTAQAQDGKLQNTIDSLNLVIHKEPSNPFPVYHKAMLFLATGSKDEAFRFFKQVGLMFAQNPADPYKDIAADSYYRMAELAYNSAKPKKEAYNYALSALKVKPEEKSYRVMSARILVRIPETQADGESQFESLINDYPNDTEVLLEYAQYLEEFSPERANAMFEKVVRNNPTDGPSLYALGNYEVEQGLKQKDPDKAVKHNLKAEGYLTAALQQDPTNDLYRKRLGDLYSNLMWYYKQKKDKESAGKKEYYQKKLTELGVKK